MRVVWRWKNAREMAPNDVKVAAHVVVAGGGIREVVAIHGSLISWIRGAAKKTKKKRAPIHTIYTRYMVGLVGGWVVE